MGWFGMFLKDELMKNYKGSLFQSKKWNKGNDIYDKDVENMIESAQLTNDVRQAEIDEIIKFLNNAMTGNEKQNKILEISTGKLEKDSQNDLAEIQNLLSLISSVGGIFL